MPGTGRLALGETRKTTRAGKKTHEPRKTRKGSLHPGYQSAAIRRGARRRRAARAQGTMDPERQHPGRAGFVRRWRDAVPARGKRRASGCYPLRNARPFTHARSTSCRRSAAASLPPAASCATIASRKLASCWSSPSATTPASAPPPPSSPRARGGQRTKRQDADAEIRTIRIRSGPGESGSGLGVLALAYHPALTAPWPAGSPWSRPSSRGASGSRSRSRCAGCAGTTARARTPPCRR